MFREARWNNKHRGTRDAGRYATDPLPWLGFGGAGGVSTTRWVTLVSFQRGACRCGHRGGETSLLGGKGETKRFVHDELLQVEVRSVPKCRALILAQKRPKLRKHTRHPL